MLVAIDAKRRIYCAKSRGFNGISKERRLKKQLEQKLKHFNQLYDSKNMIKLLKVFSKKDLLLVLVALILIVCSVWLDLRVPAYMGRITGLVTTGIYGFEYEYIQGFGNVLVPIMATVSDVWRYGGIIIGYTVGSLVISMITTLITAILASSYSAKLRQKIWLQVGDFANGDIKKFSIPSLIVRSTGDVTQVQLLVAFGMQILVRIPILVVWTVIRMTSVSRELSMITWLAVASIIVVSLIILIFCLPQFKRIRDNTDLMNKSARENLSGVRVVRAYNAESFEEAKFKKSNESLTKSNLTMNRAIGFAMPFIMLVMSAVTVAIYWVGAHLIDSGTVPYYQSEYFFADTMVFMQYAFQILGAFVMLVFMLTMLPGIIVSGRRISEILKTNSSIDSSNKKPIGLEKAFDREQNIKFDKVSFRYPGAENDVLLDISLEIKKGQTVAFIGSTGSGKSTLVNLIPRIMDATEGSITIGGKCIKNAPLEEINDIVGFVPQTAIIFSGTVRDNIALGMVKGKEITDEAIEKALRISQSKEFVDELEGRLEFEVKQRGRNFSGGQKQRLSIARTVAREPKIYIFDDTFSALDYKTDKELRDALKAETSDATVLIVAQRIGTIRNADQIFVLDEGRIVGRGSHNDLIKNCEIYKQIALSQLSEEEIA